MDFEDMEKKIVEHSIHTAIFCSPHNPTGRVWDRWEVEKYMDICQKHDVYVVSDEIWSDILRPELSHVPTQSVSPDARERTIALYAPSKTFSLAGLVGAYHIAYNKRLQDRMIKESSLSHYNNINLLSMYALIGAYSAEGRPGPRSCARSSPRMWITPAPISRTGSPGWRSLSPRAPICSIWIVPNGVRSAARPSTT